MSGRERQQQQNVKARKAKAKRESAKQFRSWIDRDRTRTRLADRPRVSPFDAAASGRDLMDRINRLAPNHERDREAAERFLCRVFGEDYRP